jgi:hypothetical protein
MYGASSLVEAWKVACELADEYGVDAIEQADETGRETDRYTPSQEDIP